MHVNRHLPPVTVKLTIKDGISLNYLLANDVQGSIEPGYNEIASLCKKLSSESDDFVGREVVEFVGVNRYDIVT